jgi:UDP-N-acetylmuramoyl-tripeptide--D-alanyl-D-alanine ligase
MARFSAGQIIKATGGQLAVGRIDITVSGVVTDSRLARPGSLFVAIRGERMDGHDYVRDAFSRGARVALVSHKLVMASTRGKTLVAVKDTTQAYLDLAAFHRARMESLTVAGVTGSNGKTTVKDMIAGALSVKYKTLKTEGNLNNQIGLPSTLLRLTPAHRAAVVEMGINRPGEMETLAAAARPNIGVITNIGAAHLEGLKSAANVRQAKAAMLDYLADGGTAILNLSDPASAPIIKSRRGRGVITFGLGSGANVAVMGDVLNKSWTGRIVTLRHAGEDTVIKVRMIGGSAAINAAAAFAAGVAAGLAPGEIARGIGAVRPAKLRMALEKLPNGAYLIDDSYNANPGSLASALLTLKDLGTGRKILVLGDMLELGASAGKAHMRAARLAKAAGVCHIFAHGPLAAVAAMEAKRLGLAATVGKSREALARAVAKSLRPGGVALVKGSRGTEMDKTAEYIRREAGVR